MKEIFIEVALMQLPAVFGFIWWVANEKSAIYTSIDEVKDSLEGKFAQLDKRMDLHIQDSHHARDSFNERLVGQGKRFGSKIERLEKYFENFLNKKDEC